MQKGRVYVTGLFLTILGGCGIAYYSGFSQSHSQSAWDAVLQGISDENNRGTVRELCTHERHTESRKGRDHPSERPSRWRI